MLKLSTSILELRAVQTKVSKKGTTYYVLMCEDIDTSEPFQFYVKKYDQIPPHLKKGDLVNVVVGYNRYKELEVLEIARAE